MALPRHAATGRGRPLSVQERNLGCWRSGFMSSRPNLPAPDKPPLLPLHYKHLGDGAAALPVRWINLLDVPDLGLAIVLELGTTKPHRANVEVFLAEVGGDLRAETLQIDVRAVAHGRLPRGSPSPIAGRLRFGIRQRWNFQIIVALNETCSVRSDDLPIAMRWSAHGPVTESV